MNRRCAQLLHTEIQSTMESFNKNNDRLNVIIHIIENKYSTFFVNMLNVENTHRIKTHMIHSMYGVHTRSNNHIRIEQVLLLAL